MNCVMPYTNFAVAGGMENNPGILHIHVGSSAQWHPQWYCCAATDPIQRWVGSLGQSGAVCTCARTGPRIDSRFPATNKHCIRNYLISAEPRSGRLISNPIVNRKVLNLLNSAILTEWYCLPSYRWHRELPTVQEQYWTGMSQFSEVLAFCAIWLRDLNN